MCSVPEAGANNVSSDFMKLLYIAPEYPSAGKNAAQVRANALVPRLREKLDLRVFSFPPHEIDEAPKPDAITTQAERARPGKVDLLGASASRNPRAFVRYDTPKARELLRQLIESYQPDVVHFDSIGTLALLDLVEAATCRPRIVAHTHDSVSQLYARLGANSSFLQRLLTRREQRKYARFEREVLPRCDTVIVDSPEDAAFLSRQTGGNRVDLVPLGVDIGRFSPKGRRADLAPRSIVFSGSMASDQSGDAANFLVNQIMPLVWDRFPDAHVYIVGGNPTARVSALAADRVTVTGFVDELTNYLRAASVYACPLRLGSGMRTRVIEALACGTRTVATSFAMRGVAVPEKGSRPWIEAEDAATLAAGILRLLDGERPDLGEQAARHAADNYSWDAVTDEIISIYEDIKRND